MPDAGAASSPVFPFTAALSSAANSDGKLGGASVLGATLVNLSRKACSRQRQHDVSVRIESRFGWIQPKGDWAAYAQIKRSWVQHGADAACVPHKWVVSAGNEVRW